MSTERPTHSHEMHFDELLAGRVVTEAMSVFDADTPLEDVLRWLHQRLSLVEEGFHVVKGFSADAIRFQPTFTIDAIRGETFDHTFTLEARFPVTPTDPKFIGANAWFTSRADIDAHIMGIQPTTQYFHYDTFTNQQNHTWGWADGVGYYTYGGSDPAKHEWNHLKADLDTDPLDEVYDYRGHVVEELPSLGAVTRVQDAHVANKRVLVCANFKNATTAQDINQRIWVRGSDTYLERGSGAWGLATRLVVDGVERYSGSGYNGFNWYKIECLDHIVRFKIWAEGNSEPSTWTYEYEGATPKAGVTALDFNGRYGGIIVPDPNGSPWTHEFKHFSVQGINAGPLSVDAYLRPAPFSASAWLSQGTDLFIDAFIEPTFRINAQLVNYVPGNFTIGSFKQDRVEGGFEMDAHIGGYMRMDAVINDDAVMGSHTADAWKVITNAGDMYADADVKDVDRTFSVTADGIVKDTDIPDDFGAAAYKNLLITDGVDVDAYLGPGAHPPADAVIKRPDQPGSFTAGSWLWPEGVELFIANAVQKTWDNSDTSTADASLIAIRDNHVAHYDEFNRTTKMRWGNPTSASDPPAGRYTYKQSGTSTDVATSELTRFYVSDGTGRFYEKNQHYAVHTDMRTPHDRQFYLEFYFPEIFIGGGHRRIGFFSNDWARLGSHDIHLRVHQKRDTQPQYLMVNGTQRDSVSLDASSRWMVVRADLQGTTLRWKLWPRGTTEPDWRVIDMSAYWTPPETGCTYFDNLSGNWFGSYGPWTNYFDNWTVEPYGGWPFGHKVDATIYRPDITHTIDAQARLVPEPFSMDAFIQPWFAIDARIWLGTTFSADAVIQREQQALDATIGYDHLYGGASSWSHTPPTNAKYLIVTTQQSGGVTFGGIAMTYLGATSGRITGYQYGITAKQWANKTSNTIVTSDSSNVNWSTFLTSQADIEYVGKQDSTSMTVTMDDTIDGPAARAMYYVFTQGKSGNPWPSFTPYQGDGVGYQLSGGGHSNPVTGNGIGAELGIDGPDTTSLTAGVVGPGVDEGDGYLFQAPNSHLAISAWINPGAHIPFDAQLTGKNVNAIIRAPFAGVTQFDAWFHQLGEQLKNFIMDASFVPSLSELKFSQFGWSVFGEAVGWGDVTPEREQDMFSASAEMYQPTYTVDVDVDAHIVPVPFTADAMLQTTQEFPTGPTADAVIDQGHFRIDAEIIPGGVSLWLAENYDDDPDEGPPTSEEMKIYMWQRYG